MMRILVLVSVGVSLFFVKSPVRGDEKKDEAPEAAVKKALLALREERFEDYAKTVHPDELKELKKSLMPVLAVAMKEGREKESLRFMNFMKVKSIDGLKDLSDDRFFAALCSAMFRLNMSLKQTFGESEAELIGNVPEGKEIAHVVCRVKMKLEEVPTKHMEVVSVKRTDAGWKLLFPSQVEVFTK